MLNIRLLSPPQTTQGTVRGLWEHFTPNFARLGLVLDQATGFADLLPPHLYFNFTLNFNMTRHKYPRPIHII